MTEKKKPRAVPGARRKKPAEEPVAAPADETTQAADLSDPCLYINRELSWLEFNWRVLEEAIDERKPLLERVKFLGIYANNLDEFFMVRVSGLRRRESAGAGGMTPDGMTPSEQLAGIRSVLLEQFKTQSDLWETNLKPLLNKAGIKILKYKDLNNNQKKLLSRYFEEQIFPALTPLLFDPSHPWPHISNLCMNLAIVLRDQPKKERFARLKMPGILPRFLPAPEKNRTDYEEYIGRKRSYNASFILLEDLVAANLPMLFRGMEIVASYPFRITRDADIKLDEEEIEDLLASVEENLDLRPYGSAVRLEIDNTMPERVKNILIRNMNITPEHVYTHTSMLGMADLMKFDGIDRPDIKYPTFSPTIPAAFSGKGGIFKAIASDDILVYHPYDSFNPTIDFLRQAANDPDVIAIKITLYRIGRNSPVVDALLEARQNGKQVAAVVELKARFDEEHNINWARKLEDEGAHVIYGVMGLKTHAKLCLVVRREGKKLACYVHLSTGNYNPVTAKLYTDIGFFSVRPELGADISELFNVLTGCAKQEKCRKILAAPYEMRKQLASRIDREIKIHEKNGGGRLMFKMNSLVDRKMIAKLYQASQKGVKVDLQVRGICCLRPGVPGVSDNIRVTSIVGRFLEHARFYYFRNGGNEEVLTGSADLMPRNLNRRVETLFPVEDSDLKRTIIDQILAIHFRDTSQCRELLPDGKYRWIKPAPGEEPFDSQQWLIEHWGQEAEE